MIEVLKHEEFCCLKIKYVTESNYIEKCVVSCVTVQKTSQPTEKNVEILSKRSEAHTQMSALGDSFAHHTDTKSKVE